MKNQIWLILLIMLTAMTAGCVKEEPDSALGIGARLPAFTVTTTDGQQFSSRMADYKIMVIVFFNTTCSDCQRELPEIQNVYQEVSNDKNLSDKVTFICIARDEGGEDIKRYWTEHGLTLPVSPQNDRKIYNMFAQTGIPRIYVAKDNKIVSTTITLDILKSLASATHAKVMAR